MENASKALIIAGAILISILIIGLGVFIYGQASSTVKKANLNSQEAQAQNQQFETYFGDKVSSTEVKALMSLIRTNNITGKTGDETKNITVVYNGNVTAPSSVSTKVAAGKTYKIQVTNDSSSDTDLTSASGALDAKEAAYYTSGYIKVISVTQN